MRVLTKKSYHNSLKFSLNRARLESCKKSVKVKSCQWKELAMENERLPKIVDEVEKYVTEHLVIGTAKIVGLEL